MPDHKNFSLVLVIGLAFIPLLAMELPRMLAFYPGVFGLLMVFWYTHGQKEHLDFCKPYLYYAASMCALILVSYLWSIAPADALKRMPGSMSILLSGVLLFSLCLCAKNLDVTPYLWLFPFAAGLAALFCGIEICLNMPAYMLIHQLGHPVNSSVMNRGITFFTLCFFPLLSISNRVELPKQRKYMLTGFLYGSTLFMLWTTQSQSAQLGFAVGLLFYYGFPYRYKAPYTILAGLVAVAILLTPIIVQILFLYGFWSFDAIDFLRQGYAAHRLEIWDFVTRYAMHNPLYGYGYEATRFVKKFDVRHLIHPDDTVLHPHNFSVQIWIEFGAVGALLASGFLASLLYRIKDLSVDCARPALGLFMCTLSISATGYGMWQGWWLGSIIFALCLLALAYNYIRNHE